MRMDDGLKKYRGLVVFRDAIEVSIKEHYQCANSNINVIRKLHKDWVEINEEIKGLELVLELR